MSLPNRPRLNATYIPLRAHQSVLTSPPCLTTPRRGHLERPWCPPLLWVRDSRGPGAGKRASGLGA